MKIQDGQLTLTKSVCPTCRKLVFTRVLIKEQKVVFEKFCRDHGVSTAIVADDAEAYLSTERYHRMASVPLDFNKTFSHGCPDDCGFCPQHEQHVCMPIIEITDHCDMSCPICIVRNRNSWHMTLDELKKILDRLIETEGRIDVANISGGEPTLHPEFEKMIEECLSRKEILRVSVSTNGLRLARDEKLRRFLAERNVVISLQFDGSKHGNLEELRANTDFASKLSLINDLSALDAPCSITLTLVPGLNEEGLSEGIELLFSRQNILSMMIQPAAYTGRGKTFKHDDRRHIFIPEVMRLIEKHAGGKVKSADFSPLPCSHPSCFSLSFFLKTDDNKYISIKDLFEPDTYLDIIRNRSLFGTDPENFGKIEEAVYELWSGPSALAPDSEKALKAVKNLLRRIQSGGGFDPARNIAVAERNIKSVFIHAFMDEDTFDLTRARKCCQVYPLRDGRFMPACVYNVLER